MRITITQIVIGRVILTAAQSVMEKVQRSITEYSAMHRQPYYEVI